MIDLEFIVVCAFDIFLRYYLSFLPLVFFSIDGSVTRHSELWMC